MTPMRGTPPSVARKQAARFDNMLQDMQRDYARNSQLPAVQAVARPDMQRDYARNSQLPAVQAVAQPPQLQQYDRLQNMPPPQRPYGGQGNDMKGTSPTGPDRYGKTAADLAAEYRNSVVPPGYEFANQRPMPQIMGGSANKMGSVPGMLGVAPAVMPRGGLGSMPANPTGPRTMGGLGSRAINPTMSGTPKTGLQGLGAALGSKLGMKPTGSPMPAQQTPQAGKPMAKPLGAPMQPQKMMKKGGAVKAPAKKMASGGKVSSASKRGDGIASKGKTNCKMY